MALAGSSRPSWQTAELSEEWPMSSPSSAGSGPSPVNQHRAASSSSASQRSLDSRPQAAPSQRADTADREASPQAPGTCLVRDDVLDTALQGPLAKLRASGGASGGGGLSGPNSPGSRSLFSPMKLESMFQPPSPPQDAGPASPSQLPEVILTPPQASTTPSAASPSPSTTASPSAPSPSPMPRPAPQQLSAHKQLYHAPQVPSRLQKTFTPADLTASTIDPGPDDTVDVVVVDDDAGPDDTTGDRPPALALVRSARSERNWPERFEFQCPPSAAAHSTPSDRSANGRRADDEPSPTAYTRLSLHTSHAQNHGPARTAPSSVDSTTAAPAAVSPSAATPDGPKKLNLFRPTYDTFTRDFMGAIVDTIETSPSSSPSSSGSAPASAAAAVRQHHRTTSDRDAAVDFRDSKRIRLTSPPAAGTRTASGLSSSSFERLRRSKAASSSGVGGRASRDWDGEARELMQRVREMGRSSGAAAGVNAANGRQPAGPAAPAVGKRPVAGQRVLSGSSGEGRGWGQGLAFSSFDGSEEGEVEDDGRRIDPIAELPETESCSPQGTEIRNYRLPSQTRQAATAAAAATTASAPAAAPRARQSASVRESAGVSSRLQATSQSTTTAGASSSAAGDTVRTASYASTGQTALSRAPPSARLGSDEKENAVPGEDFGRLRAKRQSPRKLLRRLSAADEVEKELDDEERRPATKSPLKQSQATRPPPAPSSGAAGIVPTADLSRYVSSSTAPISSIGQSTVSAASFTKHAGPPVPKLGGARSLTTIPFDEGATPLRVGRLEFDRAAMKWVKVRDAHARVGSGASRASEDDDDPFKDFNSTVASGKAGAGPRTASGNLIEQLRASSTTPPQDDASTGAGARFTRDASSRSLSLPRSFERSLSVSSNRGGDGFDMDEVAASLKSFQFPSSSSSESLAASPDKPSRPPPLQHHNSAPLPAVASTPLPAHQQQQRSRVASTGGLRPCMTPVSVLKKRSPGVGFRGDAETPGSTVHRRSVSFSDGKKAGKIDLQVEKIEFSLLRKGKARDADADRSAQPSARAVRIQSMLDGLGDDEVTESMASLAEQTPSKGGSFLRHYKPRDPPRAAAALLHQDDDTDDGDETESTAAANLTLRSVGAGARSFHYGGKRGAPGDATFLTECSFDGVRNRLVEIITDVHPYVAYWEKLRELNLEGRLAGSVARLKEFLPRLVEVNLNRNDLSYLSGLPASVETLHAAHNRLSELTAVAHLSNLRFLDISFNQLEAVNQLDCLKNLTELCLDSNSITDISPLFGLSTLTGLSAAGNGIVSLDVSSARWPHLQSLDLSRNNLTDVVGLDRLKSLTSLTLDENRLRRFDPAVPLSKLKTLKISGNRLRRLDIQAFPHLRTLYADNNELETINPTGARTRLQTLSARSQADAVLVLSGRELRDVKRLFLSGNAVPASLFDEPCPNLGYLELASCKLARLPAAFAAFAPGLKSLNLNYNYLADVGPLAHLRRLRKLSVVGSRLETPKPVVQLLQTLPALEMIDLRMNPFTLAMYLPLIVGNLAPSAAPDLGSSASTALSSTTQQQQPSSSSSSDPAPTSGARWAELDAAFRRALPDEWYVRRLAHRGLAMRACPRLTTLDGVVVEDGERRKADELLATLQAERRE